MIKTTVSVSGMMCGMCESHINDCIRNSFRVKKVSSSHTLGRTVIISEEPLDETLIREKINSTGYTVTSITSEPQKKGLFGLGK